MEQNPQANAARLVGEIFLPGASQYISGNVSSGLAHTLLSAAAAAALIGTGVAPVVGALTVLGIKLNSFTSATTGRSVASHAGEIAQQAEARLRSLSLPKAAPKPDLPVAAP